jgi:hypothetical protein
MFWGGLGEGGSEDLPVRFEAAAAGEGFSADETANSACTPGPPPPWLEWLVLVLRGRKPFRRSVCPEVVAAAVLPPGTEVVAAAARAGVGEPPGVLLPRRPSNVGGRSYLRGQNRSSVCNGTLSAGVCSLWLSRPEHVGILMCNTMFSPRFRALGLACRLAKPLNQM